MDYALQVRLLLILFGHALSTIPLLYDIASML